jgi:LEA14-like dessication related protein
MSYALTLSTASLLAACASAGNLISAPGVSLKNVQMTEVDFSGQTFLLGFDVSNPNPFPLPISAVSYGVELDGYRFAAGETKGGFTVPASGDQEFAISVELNLLKTAPQLLFIVRDAEKRDIPYELNGKLGVDIPFTDPVSFESSGAIRLQARQH